jgi:biopolymer transport protein ExbD
MNGMKLLNKTTRKITLNLTSLIDVLFILIIFFTVSSTFLEQPGIQLQIPEAETSETHTVQKVVIYVNKEGRIYVNDDSVSMDNMIEAVQQLVSAQTDKSVVLQADSNISHGFIIKIMDRLRKNGIYKIVISTLKPMDIM